MREMKNFDGYSPRQVLEILKKRIEEEFKDAHPFLMDEMTDRYKILQKLKKEIALTNVFFALMFFANMAILIFDVVLKNGKIWIPSPTGPLSEATFIRLYPEWTEKTVVFARKLDKKIFEKLPPYIYDVIYRKGTVLFSSTEELIEKVLKVLEKRIKEWGKEKIKRQLRIRKRRRTVGFYVDELGRKRKIER